MDKGFWLSRNLSPKAAREAWGRAVWEAVRTPGSNCTPHCWVVASRELEIYSLERVKEKVLDQQHGSVIIHNEVLILMSKPIALLATGTWSQPFTFQMGERFLWGIWPTHTERLKYWHEGFGKKKEEKTPRSLQWNSKSISLTHRPKSLIF